MSSPMRPIQSLQLAQRIAAAGPEGLGLGELKRVAEELGLDEKQCIFHQRHLRHKARRQGLLPPAEGPWNPLGERCTQTVRSGHRGLQQNMAPAPVTRCGRPHCPDQRL